MTPKYRGNDDDWLDAEKERGGQGAGRTQKGSGKKKKPAKGYLAITEANGTIAEVFPNQCKVIADGAPAAEREVACTYRKAKLPTGEIRERAPVAVGDRVRFERISQRDGVIDGVCERRNFLARPAPERAMRHTLVANVDMLVIVVACHEPEFSPGIVDRFLVAALAQGIEPLICVTKMDLFTGGDRPWTLYTDVGFKVIETCAKTGKGLSDVKAALDGKLATFCGHSGVGKTSLLNALLGFEVGRTGEVNAFTGKGSHTTTGAYLIPDSQMIDTPGIREFGLLGIEAGDLRKYFPEFEGKSCADEDCWHRDEEGCAVQDLPRYGSYRRMVESLLAGEN